MSLDASEIEWAGRLSAQLKSLSEVIESLTYKVLELEERFAEREQQASSRRQAVEERHSDVLDTMRGRLHDTDERLARLEDVLRAGEPPALVSRLSAHSPLRAHSRPPVRPPRDSVRRPGSPDDDRAERTESQNGPLPEGDNETSLAS